METEANNPVQKTPLPIGTYPEPFHSNPTTS